MRILAMLESSEAQWLLPYLALGAGIISHRNYFHHGRHGARAPKYALITAFIALLSILHWAVLGPEQYLFLGSVLRFANCFILGIYGSAFVYRVWLSPLNKFPGPKLARISDLWLTYQSRHYDWHERSLALYRKYGSYIRVGSSTLLVVEPASVLIIFGSQSKCVRGEWYSAITGNRGIASTDANIHYERRRVWSQAFGTSAMKDYENRIQTYVDKFVRVVGKASQHGQPLDITKWGSYYAWDLMGDMGLAKDFSLMDTGNDNGVLNELTDMMASIGLRTPSWLMTTAKAMSDTGGQNAIKRFENYCNKQLDTQIQKTVKGKRNNDRHSILDILLEQADLHHLSPTELGDLQADCETIIIAGSDTTASTLVFAMYFLATQPHDVVKMRRELLPLMKDGAFRHIELQHANHLNGVVNEALRLFPPGTILPRETPPEGVQVGDTYIPGGTTVLGSQYILGRSEEVYERPLEFLPERWYAKPEMVKAKEAYAPFNIGPHACIGKPLALMELRMLFANLFMRFNIDFSSPKDAAHFIEGVKDCHTWRVPELMLRFTPVDAVKTG